MEAVWLRIENLQVTLSGKEILNDISLEIRQGEQWAVFGEAGVGKTIFAHTLAGNHSFQGKIQFTGNTQRSLSELVLVVDQQHRFRDLQNQTNFYYQQRYNSFDAEATMTVAENLAAYPDGLNETFSRSDLLEIFRLHSLLNEPLIQLSNGENKRLQILKALLQVPELLILDEPFTGLDAEGRIMLAGILEQLTGSGQKLMLFSSRDFIPASFNRYAGLQNGRLQIFQNKEEIVVKTPGSMLPVMKPFPSSVSFEYPAFQHAVRMLEVHVKYDGKTILEGITWTVDRGSRWALTGHNGAGKSTLLSLITADNPQAYANDIYLFDRRRGTGESIWEIKQKTGFLSPELQLYFDPSATAFTALASGLFDTIGLFRSLSSSQEQLVWEWLEFLDCKNYANRLLSSLPAGIQRLILLGRAMIKTPPLLILDEPCQGLDKAQTAFALQTIDRYCSHYRATLIFVSHYAEDFPEGVGQVLRLEKGRVT